jgi:hypothetical protein
MKPSTLPALPAALIALALAAVLIAAPGRPRPGACPARCCRPAEASKAEAPKAAPAPLPAPASLAVT